MPRLSNLHAEMETASATAAIPLTASLLLLLAGAFPASAQNVSQPSPAALASTPRFADISLTGASASGLLGPNGNFLGIGGAGAAPSGRGTAFSELLRGRGSRTGYVLSHGGVVTDTIRVEVSGRSLQINQDYWLDAANGSLFFAQTVSASDTVQVYYRYVDGQDATRQTLSVPGLQLNFGAGSKLGLLYGTTPNGAGTGLDVSTYGLNLSTKFGAGRQSSFGGLAYFSNPQRNTNVALPVFALSGDKSATVKSDGSGTPSPEADHLLAQNLALSSGRVGVRVAFQDIGKNFSGFQSMKLNAGSDKTALDQIAALEGEKGVKRLGLGLNFGSRPNGAGGFAPGGLALNWNQIQDGKGTITQQAVGFQSSRLHFDYSSRSVEDKFALFSGLHETEKADWEREKGLTASRMALGLNFGANHNGSGAAPSGIIANGLNFARESWGDKDGSLNAQSVSLQSGGLTLRWLDRKTDLGFKRLGDLSKDDKTAFALDVRRAFDPNAKVESVTDGDRTAVGKEAGLERSVLGGSLALGKAGKTGVFSVTNLRVTQQNLTTAATPTGDDKTKPTIAEAKAAAIRRSEVTFANKAVQFRLLNQSISSDFNGLADRSDVEKAQFGSEHGLSRREQSLFWQMNSVTKIGFNSLRVSPTNEAVANAIASAQSATDGGKKTSDGKTLAQLTGSATDGASRDNVSLESKGFKFAASQGMVGKAFARSADLALPDADKSRIEADRGFTTRDLNLKLDNLPLLARVPGLSHLTVDVTQASGDNATDKISRDKYNRNIQLAPSPKLGLSVSYLGQGDTLRDGDKINGTTHSLLELKQQFGKTGTLTASQDDSALLANNASVQTTQQTRTNTLGFEGAKNLPASLKYQAKYTTNPDKTFENTTSLNVAVKPVNSFSFTYTRSDYAKGDLDSDDARTDLDDTEKSSTAAKADPNAPSGATVASASAAKSTDTSATTTAAKTDAAATASVPTAGVKAADVKKPDNSLKFSTDTFGVELQAAKNFAVTAGVTQKNSSDDKNANSVSVGLKGQPVKDITLAASFDEHHDNGVNTKDLADIAISNAKPLALGPIRDITVTARYASLNDQRKLQNETMTGRASFTVWKNQFLLDYGGLTKENGDSTITRVYSFTTDPNPKKWFKGSFLYKQKTLITGDDQIIRRFALDWKLAKTTSFVYTYGTLPEDEAGNVTPLTTLDLAFKHSFRDRFSGSFFYRVSDNSATKTLTRALGMGIEGKLSANTKYALSYSLDVSGLADHYVRGNGYRMSFDQQISPDHFLTLSGNLRTHDANNRDDDTVANLDFRTRF